MREADLGRHLLNDREKEGAAGAKPEDAAAPTDGSVQPLPARPKPKPLAPGETLLLLTDGVLDAEGPSGDRFGEERLDPTLAAGSGHPVELVRHLVRTVAEFTGDVPQADDVTVLAVTRHALTRLRLRSAPR